MDTAFHADPAKCIGCGQCVRDGVAGIITLENGKAQVAPADAPDCICCQHCLTICPTAAVRVCGLKPEDSVSLAGFKPDADNLEKLVMGRRSVRRFADEPVPEAVLDRIMTATSYAPTGVNARQRRFAVLRDAGAMDDFRKRTNELLVASADRIPEQASWMVDAAQDWLKSGDDMIFRTAPHLMVATVDEASPCADVDAVIAVSFFDLIAQANGVGTVWAGMIYNLMRFLPEMRLWLGIPENHRVGYAMLFGLPAVRYPRAAQHRPESVKIITSLS